jgi:hypothetical protein
MTSRSRTDARSRGIPAMLVSDTYEGHHSPRIATKAAYDAYWKARAESPAWFPGVEHLTIDDQAI